MRSIQSHVILIKGRCKVEQLVINAKQHEILAVEKDREKVAKGVVQEGINTFSKKTEHFDGHVKTLTMFDASRQAEEDSNTETREVVTDVHQKLAHIGKYFSNWINVISIKEFTNTDIKADVVIEGQTIMTDIPATLLLTLENRLTLLRGLFKSAPTLDPGTSWTRDDSLEGRKWKSLTPEIRDRTQKIVEPVVLYDATKEHPAQVKEYPRDVVVGQFSTQKYSGRITPREKSEMLERLDKLLEAVKIARTKANQGSASGEELGDTIWDYLVTGSI